jgi:hypothetical protein
MGDKKIDPRDNVVAIGPKKGACYVCSADLEGQPSIQVHVTVPLVKVKRVVGRSCVDCALEFRALLDLRISQAKSGEFQG